MASKSKRTRRARSANPKAQPEQENSPQLQSAMPAQRNPFEHMERLHGSPTRACPRSTSSSVMA
jgi:hypothetical protein